MKNFKIKLIFSFCLVLSFNFLLAQSNLITGVAFDIKKLDYKEIYNHFRDLKYNYIRNNYPNIYDSHDAWRNLNYNKN